MIRNLSDIDVSNLVEGILKRAYEDYYITCVVPRKLPRRPKVWDVCRGKRYRRYMDDHERHLYLLEFEYKRKKRRAEVLAFFRSEWYATLAQRENANNADTRRILAAIRERRLKRLPLFSDGTCDDMDY